MPGRLPRVPLPRRADAGELRPHLRLPERRRPPPTSPSSPGSSSSSSSTPRVWDFRRPPPLNPTPPGTPLPSSSKSDPFRMPPAPVPPNPKRDPALLPPNRPATPAAWVAHKARMRELYPSGWSPPRKISREAMNVLRVFHQEDPEQFGVQDLAERFQISTEAVRRILRSRWQPGPKREMRMRRREAADERAEELARARRREERLHRMVQARAITAAGRAVRALGGSTIRELPEEEEEEEEGEGDVVHERRERRGREGRVTLEDRLLAARLRAAQESSREVEVQLASEAARPSPTAGTPANPAPPARQAVNSTHLPLPHPSLHTLPDLSLPLPALLTASPANSALRAAYEKRAEQAYPSLGIGGVRRSWGEVRRALEDRQALRAGLAGWGGVPGPDQGRGRGRGEGRERRGMDGQAWREVRRERERHRKDLEGLGGQVTRREVPQEVPEGHPPELRASSELHAQELQPPAPAPVLTAIQRMKAAIEQRQARLQKREEGRRDADKLLSGRMGSLRQTQRHPV